MAVKFYEINKEHREFIEKQKMFVIGSAASEGFINVSPKGMDSFRILDEKTVLWLNHTGSGNETSAHVQENGRMTIMFNSYDKKPMIMKLYGNAEVFHSGDSEWDTLLLSFPEYEGVRQIFKMDLELLLTSCGFGVPQYKYIGERNALQKWAKAKGHDGMKEYWAKKNVETLDGVKTNIIELSK